MKRMGLFGLILFLAMSMQIGCHSGGGGGQPTIISGTASKGPVIGGTVKVFAILNGIEDTSAPLGQGPTDDKGNYSVNIGAYTGPVLVEVSGGSFVDEASGASVTLKAPLRTLISSAVTGTLTVSVTPLTELAYKKSLGAGIMTADVINDANAGVSSFFGLPSILSVSPLAGAGDDDQKKYAAILASFSQYVINNKKPTESLDDALARQFTQMGDEMENTGGLLIGTIDGLNTAIKTFQNSGKNTTGAVLSPLPAPTSGLLKLATSGIADSIGAIDVTVSFPAGVHVASDEATGEPSAGVVTISGSAAADSNALSSAKFTPASAGSPGQLHIALASVTGFKAGEFATITFELDAGGSFPVSASTFTIAAFSAVEANGTTINGITAAPASVAVEIK